MKNIPFSKITIGKEEERAVRDVFRSGWVVLGPKTLEFEKAFAKYVGAKYAVFVDSGTSALFLAIKAAEYKEYVTIPSLTFVSGAEVVHHAGLEIRFADVDIDTLCVDMDHLHCLPTNLAGVRAKAKGKVIDSCHRIEKNDVRGSSSLWCYSLYATKNISCVHGGMIALNDKSQYEWLLMARDHGMTKGTAQRYKGKDPTYDVLFPGWRMKGNDLMAVIGLEQLKKLPKITQRRNEIVKLYNKKLGQKRKGNHLYWIFVYSRRDFIKEMFRAGIQTSIHFRPIHTFTAYKNTKADLPITNYVEDMLVSLPMYPQMSNADVDRVCEAVLKTKRLV